MNLFKRNTTSNEVFDKRKEARRIASLIARNAYTWEAVEKLPPDEQVLVILEVRRAIPIRWLIVIAIAALIYVSVLVSWSSAPVAFVYLVSAVITVASLSLQWRRCAHRLSTSDDVAIVPALAMAINVRNRAVRDATRTGLVRLLPSLQASPRIKEWPQCAGELLTFLNSLSDKANPSTHELDLAKAILLALPQIGDTSFVDLTTRWAGGQVLATALREAAQQALPGLLEHIRLSEMEAGLLRASQMDAGPELVRGADKGDVPQEQLLRPTE